MWAQRALPQDIGRLIPAANLHITLFFLGNVSADRQRCVETAADAVHAPCFNLDLDCFGYWRKPQVIWLAPRTTPPALQRLAGQLQQGLAGCGFSAESRTYQPHLTLVRKVRRGPPAVCPESLIWPVDHFVLVRSELDAAGSRYKILRSWALGQG